MFLKIVQNMIDEINLDEYKCIIKEFTFQLDDQDDNLIEFNMILFNDLKIRGLYELNYPSLFDLMFDRKYPIRLLDSDGGDNLCSDMDIMNINIIIEDELKKSNNTLYEYLKLRLI